MLINRKGVDCVNRVQKDGTYIINELLQYIKDKKKDDPLVIMATEVIIDAYDDLALATWAQPYESDHFKLYFTTSSNSIHQLTNTTDSDSNSKYDVLEDMLSYLETSYSTTVTTMGYRRPFNYDDSYGKIDVYVGDLAAGGYCIPIFENGIRVLVNGSEFYDNFSISGTYVDAGTVRLYVALMREKEG